MCIRDRYEGSQFKKCFLHVVERFLNLNTKFCGIGLFISPVQNLLETKTVSLFTENKF